MVKHLWRCNLLGSVLPSHILTFNHHNLLHESSRTFRIIEQVLYDNGLDHGNDSKLVIVGNRAERDPSLAVARMENHFTVFIRLPFSRGNFVDPPPVAWSATKERALWDVISRQGQGKGNEIDWRALANQFEVTQPFILQQAAWLYERQLSQVRAQLKKVSNRQSATPSPVPGSMNSSLAGGQPMKRAGSGGSRVPSRLSTQHVGSPSLAGEGSTPPTPAKSRTSLPLKTAAVNAQPTQVRAGPGSSRPLSRQPSKKTIQQPTVNRGEVVFSSSSPVRLVKGSSRPGSRTRKMKSPSRRLQSAQLIHRMLCVKHPHSDEMSIHKHKHKQTGKALTKMMMRPTCSRLCLTQMTPNLPARHPPRLQIPVRPFVVALRQLNGQLHIVAQLRSASSHLQKPRQLLTRRQSLQPNFKTYHLRVLPYRAPNPIRMPRDPRLPDRRTDPRQQQQPRFLRASKPHFISNGTVRSQAPAWGAASPIWMMQV